MYKVEIEEKKSVRRGLVGLNDQFEEDSLSGNEENAIGNEKNKLLEDQKNKESNIVSDKSTPVQLAEKALKINSGELIKSYLEVGTELFKSSRYEKIDFSIAASSENSQDDWAGQYFAFDKKISEGYDSDFLPTGEKKGETSGSGKVYLHTFKVKKKIPIIENKNNNHGGGSFRQEDKASAIKEFLIENKGVVKEAVGEETKDVTIFSDINHETKLMPMFAEKGVAFNSPHDSYGQKREIIMGAKLAEDSLNLVYTEEREYNKYKLKKTKCIYCDSSD
ncbi:hypothetical protein Xsto_01022 [Xenorhabdus stockiae]|uniref:Uncharacterized protein n=1 Tax=Xenorhabdus stockiae TaxID=351614 RepID=A0A2D0KTE3_9GAMM|nr:hypothetical protein [Xenorhabdus stockiae]PHM66693.1 hypothetical protein Xsto_01022 [Xenorhabdus stockiae]